LRILAHVQWLPQWTSKATNADEIDLKMYWYKKEEIPENWIDWMPEYRKQHCSLLLSDEKSLQ
jgi:hypothetical protein